MAAWEGSMAVVAAELALAVVTVISIFAAVCAVAKDEREARSQGAENKQGRNEHGNEQHRGQAPSPAQV